ncbi:MAG: aspartate kinase [Desulfovibrio sp.]|jgi:aspartate kinase|nr:aspartate kinase [Desulfovibrio sp.]
MRIRVQKFGGTSVATRERMLRVLDKVGKGLEEGNKMLVVLSARAGETDKLLALAQEWSANPDPAEQDALVSTGEQASAALFSMLLCDAGIRGRSCNGAQLGIMTDEDWTKARIRSVDTGKIRKLLENYDVLVVTGFQGVTRGGRITTLGRGGSDTSAVALAAAAGADLCEIYTDVEGVFTTDPNICSQARKLDRISYDEMLEMASMGAKVLEIRSVEFAKKFSVPVLVRSTFSDEPGTLVTGEDHSMENILVSGIAYDKDQARVSLCSVKDVPGAAAAIFGPLAEAGLSVDMILQNPSHDGVTDVNFTVSRKNLKRTLEIMEGVRETMGGLEVRYDEHVAKVSAIGVGMRNHAGVAAETFAALQSENINILMISTSEIKLSCVIHEKYAELAVRTLHQAFGLEKSSYPEDAGAMQD